LAAFSNTLLREVLQAHRDYWTKVRRLTEDIPKLKVYIVTKEEEIPQGFDEITDKQYDVLFHDETKYDENNSLHGKPILQSVWSGQRQDRV
jgi:NTE family protein